MDCVLLLRIDLSSFCVVTKKAGENLNLLVVRSLDGSRRQEHCTCTLHAAVFCFHCESARRRLG
jgi:hypothetical protein